MVEYQGTKREGGGIGRRARLRGVWATMWVQVPSFAPNKEDSTERLGLFFHSMGLEYELQSIKRSEDDLGEGSGGAFVREWIVPSFAPKIHSTLSL